MYMPENNFKIQLENFYFHDAEIENVHLTHQKHRIIKCEILMSSVEKEEQDTLTYGNLKICFNRTAHVEWHDTLLSGNPIYDVEFDYKLDDMIQLEEKRKQMYPKDYTVTLFEKNKNFLAVKFILCNYARGLEDSWGHLYLFGYDVEMEWVESV